MAMGLKKNSWLCFMVNNVSNRSKRKDYNYEKYARYY